MIYDHYFSSLKIYPLKLSHVEHRTSQQRAEVDEGYRNLPHDLNQAATDPLKSSVPRVESTDLSSPKAFNQMSILRTCKDIKREATPLFFSKANFTLDVFRAGIPCIPTTMNPLKTFCSIISYRNVNSITKVSLHFCGRKDLTLEYWGWYGAPRLPKRRDHFKMVVKYLIRYFTGIQTIWVLGDVYTRLDPPYKEMVHSLTTLLVGIPTISSFRLLIDSLDGRTPTRTGDSRNLKLLAASIQRQVDENHGVDNARTKFPTREYYSLLQSSEDGPAFLRRPLPDLSYKILLSLNSRLLNISGEGRAWTDLVRIGYIF